MRLNKRALVSLVAHLIMVVYKGIGKHSSSLSPAMNFDRSAVRLSSLHGEKFPLIMLTNQQGVELQFFYI